MPPSPPPPILTSDGRPGPQPQPPKLRSSCDRCGQSKVRCDRGRPQCGRCKTSGLGCVYGPSRKYGKPPRKRPAPAFGVHSPAEKRIRTSSNSVSGGSALHAPAESAWESPGVGGSAPVNTSGPGLVGSSDGGGVPFSGEMMDAAYPPMPLNNWALLDDLELDFGDIPLAPGLETTGTAGPAASHDGQASHCCPREAYEIFRDLICPSGALHAPHSNSTTVSAQLDEVLHFNRSAVDRLSRVLKCPCAKSGHRAMVHASIVSRILIWYQQAAGCSRTMNSTRTHRESSESSSSTSRHASPSSSSASPPSPSETGAGGTREMAGGGGLPSLVQVTGFAVEHVPVSVGSFGVEDQDLQATLRIQLVLSELKRMADLIDLFISQDSGDSNSNSSSRSRSPSGDGGKAGGLYSHLGRWLRSELVQTVRALKSRVRVLNEKLHA